MSEERQRRAWIDSFAIVGVLAVFVALTLAAATGRWWQVAEVVIFLA